MISLLQETMLAIALERDTAFDRAFALSGEILHVYGEQDLAARLYAEIPVEEPWENVADLLAMLTWTTSDNGGAIMKEMEQWLDLADDARKIRIALNLDAYPFLDRSEMERVLSHAASRLPEVAALCQQRIDERQKLGA